MPRLKEQEGFTLVELLMVILIIGLLASIAIPIFNGQRNKARNVAAVNALAAAMKAAKAYYISDGNESYAGLSAPSLNQLESSLATTEPYGAGPVSNAFSSPGSSANPSVIFIGNGTNEGNPGAGAQGIVLCSVSRGDSIFCAAMHETNGQVRFRRFRTSNSIVALDGTLGNTPTYSLAGAGPRDVNRMDFGT